MLLRTMIENINYPFILDKDLNNLYSPIDTEDFQKNLKDYVMNFYGSRCVKSVYENVTDITKVIGSILYKTNEYKYKGLYDSMNLDYNPIENYSMTEKEDMKKGEQINNNTTGEQIVTDNIGEVVNNESLGNKVESNKHSIAPYDSNIAKLESVDERTSNAIINKYTKESSVNSTSVGERTDSNTEGAREDERTLTRSGNIGVTTSQQMIESERMIRDFNYYKIIARDIVFQLCSNVWGVNL